MKIMLQAWLDDRAHRRAIPADLHHQRCRQPILGRLLSSLGESGFVNLQPLAERGNRIDRTAREYWIAVLSGESESIGAVGGESNRRMRLLQRLRHDLDVIDIKMLSVKREAI